MKNKYKARYVRKGVSPFNPDLHLDQTAFGFITAEIDDKISFEEVKKMACESTPKGYEFIEVLEIK